MKKAAVFFLAILLIICSLTSCGGQKRPISCREILSSVTDAEIGLPAGKFYSLKALEGEDEYLPPSLIGSLLGNGSYPEVAESWLDCALYLSLGAHPCEFAVILCQSRDDAEDTAKLFCARLASIKLVKSKSEHADLLDDAKITITGNYVLFIISSDSDTALSVAKKAIRATD